MNRCAACPNINACIPPNGPTSRGGVLFVGEAPGKDEDKQARLNPPGVPFIGRTGEEVNRHYLPLAGLRRDRVCFHNSISCLPITAGGKLDPKRAKDLALLESCATARLYPLIERMHPSTIVPLGQFACRAIFGEAFDLELRHGMPTMTPWGIPAFPMYHPALGLHEPKKMIYIRADWRRLKQFLDGTLHIPEDPYPEPDYAECLDAVDIDIDPDQPLAADTESSREGAFCLTYSQRAGTGRLIRADREDLLAVLQLSLNHHRAPILFHNWLYDWSVTDAMGLSFPFERIVDTMVRVYHLGNLPQGLKALGFRELGMVMQDFDDLVSPYSRQEVLDYYWRAYAETWDKPEPQTVRGEDGKWKLYQPQSMNTKLKRFFTDLKKNPDKDVFGMWTENWTEEQGMIEARLGPWPGMDIRHAPFEKVLNYACRDADALIRLWRDVLQPMSRLVRKCPQEQWRERARVA